MDLPDGREIALSNGAWPVWGAAMPWVERIEDVSGPVGTAPVLLVDNKTLIDAQIAAWNSAQSWPPPPPPPCGGKSGGSSVGGAAGKGGVAQGAGGVTGAGATGTGGASGSVGGAAANQDDVNGGGGGCSVPGAGPGGAVGLGWIALALAAARRRKKLDTHAARGDRARAAMRYESSRNAKHTTVKAYVARCWNG
jgi:MYXO-CTERM domain-containing protein